MLAHDCGYHLRAIRGLTTSLDCALDTISPQPQLDWYQVYNVGHGTVRVSVVGAGNAVGRPAVSLYQLMASRIRQDQVWW